MAFLDFGTGTRFHDIALTPAVTTPLRCVRHRLGALISSTKGLNSDTSFKLQVCPFVVVDMRGFLSLAFKAPELPSPALPVCCYVRNYDITLPLSPFDGQY